MTLLSCCSPTNMVICMTWPCWKVNHVLQIHTHGIPKGLDMKESFARVSDALLESQVWLLGKRKSENERPEYFELRGEAQSGGRTGVKYPKENEKVRRNGHRLSNRKWRRPSRFGVLHQN